MKRLCLIAWQISTTAAPVSHIAITIVAQGMGVGALTGAVSGGALVCAGAVVVVLPVGVVCPVPDCGD